MKPLLIEKPTLPVIRAIVEHAAADDQREWGTTHFGGWSGDLITATIGTYLDGVAHVFREADGTPFCATGCVMTGPGVARAWTIRTDAWKHHLLSCARMTRRIMARVMASGTVNRLEAWCPAWADKWPRALGFEREAVLRRYATDGTDIVIWSKVRE